MNDPIGEAARTAAAILAPDLGPNLQAEVETALHARNRGEQRPGRYDPLAVAGLGIGAASLIVSVAQLAWSLVSNRRKQAAELSVDFIARQVRVVLRQQDIPVAPGNDHIIDVVITEVIRLESRPPNPGS